MSSQLNQLQQKVISNKNFKLVEFVEFEVNVIEYCRIKNIAVRRRKGLSGLSVMM